MSILGQEKSRQALGSLPADSVWLFITREGSDPGAKLVFDAAVSGEAAFMLHPRHGALALVANYDEGHVERLAVFDEIRSYDRSFADGFSEWMRQLAPTDIYLNFSERDILCDGLTHGQYLRLCKLLAEATPGLTPKSSEPFLAEVRGRKTPEEVARLQKAIDGSAELYAQLLPQLRPGMSEREIQALMKELAAELGYDVHLGDYGGPLVCINRIGLAHRAPGDDRLEPGDLLILDHGLGFQGYHSDIARTVYIPREGESEPPEAERTAFSSALQAIEAAFATMRPGVKGFEVDAAARKVHLDNGFPEISHATGHQIGRHVHDGGTMLGPRWERYGETVLGELAPGNVFTIEPTILMSPLPSMLVEENVLITEEGVNWLSSRQTSLWMSGRSPQAPFAPTGGPHAS